MTVVDVDNLATDALAIVEKYEVFVRYLYPILQRSPRQHGVFRDVVLAMLFSPVGGLYHAARSRQVSRLYAVDAEFATLRSHLRFSASTQMKIITPHQHKTALARAAQDRRLPRRRRLSTTPAILRVMARHARFADTRNLVRSLTLAPDIGNGGVADEKNHHRNGFRGVIIVRGAS